MITKTGSNKFAAIFSATLVLALVFTFIPMRQAHAYTYTPVTGVVGGLVLPKIFIGDLFMPAGTSQFTLYGESGPLAFRSPATLGVQIVRARYLVETWNGSSWVITANSGLMEGRIGLNDTSVRFAAPYMQPVSARGTFRFTFAFDWYTPDGVMLGSTFMTSNMDGDHVCVTKVRLCQTYSGYFRTGGYLTGDW